MKTRPLTSNRIITIAFCLLWVTGVAQSQTIYWIESTFSSPTLNKALANGTNQSSLGLNPGSLPQGLMYDAVHDSVYWVELAFANAQINIVSPLLLANRSILGNGSALRDIAIDDQSGKIYWTATNLQDGSAIFRANLDGTSLDTLIRWAPNGAQAPFGIALDVAGGKMYWADFDLGSIWSATLNGLNQQEILSNLQGPSGLRLDTRTSKLYWTEFNGRTVQRANADGTGQELLVTTSGRPNHIDLDTLGGKMYWSEIASGLIRRADLDGQNAENIPIAVSNPVGIAVSRSPATDVELTHRQVPTEFALEQNYPNPFNPSTSIGFSIPRTSDVTLKVFDVLGKEVTTLASGTYEPGAYAFSWNASNIPSGVYYYRFTSDHLTAVRKMILVR